MNRVLVLLQVQTQGQGHILSTRQLELVACMTTIRDEIGTLTLSGYFFAENTYPKIQVSDSQYSQNPTLTVFTVSRSTQFVPHHLVYSASPMAQFESALVNVRALVLVISS